MTEWRICANLRDRMKTLLALRPRNYKHRRARVLLALAAELCALVVLALLCVWYVASR